MEKTLTQDQVKTILTNAPRGTDPKKIVQGLVDRGYTLQGLNDQPQETKSAPTSGVTNQGIQDAHGQAKAAIGGAAQGLGASLPLAAIDFAGRKIVNAVGTDQMKQNLENTPSLNEQFSKTFGMDEHPTAAAVGSAAGTVGSLLPFSVEQGAKLLATEKGQKIAENVGNAVKTIKQAGQGALNTLNESLPIAEKSTQTGANFIQDLVSPKATEAVKELAIKQGRVVEPSLLSPGKILPSKRDAQLAEAVQPFVSDKATPVENLNNISQGVQEINNGVKSYVKTNKVPFNTNQLKSQLNQGKDELNLIFASDAQAEKTYNAVVDEFIKHVKSKDTAGLLDARQEFDKIPAIKKLLDSQGLGENTKKEVVLTVRDMANRYVASLLPEGNQYRQALQQESKMIEAIGNIAEKSTGLVGQNKIQLLTKKYPVLKGVIGTIGAYLGLKATGVGGSIIGSSD